MTYRQLLLAIRTANELESELFWAREQVQNAGHPKSSATLDDLKAAVQRRQRAVDDLGAEIDFASL